MLKILDVEGAVRRDGRRWQLVDGADWTYDGERYAQVTALRRAEQEAMAAFGTDGRCLMRVLQEELDDPEPQDCGRCSVCTTPRFAEPPDPALVELAGRHLRSRPIELEVKKMAPDAAGTMRKIADDVRIEPGWALARFGDGGWWPAIERGLRAGEFDDEVAVGLADILRRGGAPGGSGPPGAPGPPGPPGAPGAPGAPRGAGSPVSWVTTVPSARSGAVIRSLADRLARELAVPHVELVTRTEPRPPQREMANAAQQAANVRGAFKVTAQPPPGTGVLLDDRRHSGWTLAMVGGQLRRAGAERVVPLVLGTLN
jgi:ATP-dependent DNA helicase RecQ